LEAKLHNIRAMLVRVAAAFALVCVAGHAAEVCDPNAVAGRWGFQLAGRALFTGNPVPVVSVGRLEFGSDGKASGVTSVNFNGYYLGNPVTGTYEARADCTVTWALQDDSGAWQHFAGKAATDGTRVEFQQSDPGAAIRGVMQKVPAECGAEGVRGVYRFTISGKGTPFGEGSAGASVSATAAAAADGAGNLTLEWGRTETSGTYTIGSDCFAELELGIPAADGVSSELIALRGILVDGGKEVLAIQKDPGRVAAARLVSR